MADHFFARRSLAAALSVLVCLAAGTGCHSLAHQRVSLHRATPNTCPPPRELAKVAMPDYQIEPPDILQIEVLKLVPRPPYRVEVSDLLDINVLGVPPDMPIRGVFLVGEGGKINLGPGYGRMPVPLAGLTIEEAEGALKTFLQSPPLRLRAPEVFIELARPSGVQQVSGQYLVAADGKINLRRYGKVYVAGKSIGDAQVAIEAQLAEHFDQPKVSVDVVAYNSKVYYIITSGAGMGDNVVRVPVTGNETVLDAIAQVQGLSQMSSKKIWIARPSVYDLGYDQVLPVDYDAMTRGGRPFTNYQVMPGDRVYIAGDDAVALDNWLSKVIAPFERVAGAATLGASTIRNFNNLNSNFGTGF